MSFSLIVCTIGRVEPLRRLLASLDRQTVPPLEVIVVDQNPSDIIGPVLAQFPSLPLKRLRSGRGLSLARNVGLQQAAGDVVAFPDDDCWYGPDVLDAVGRLFAAHPGLAIVTGRTTDAAGRNSVGAFRAVETQISRRDFVDCGNSNGLFVRREAARAIGPFDVRLGVGAPTPFGSGEEADYLLRAVEQGLEARFFPSLVVFHEQVDATFGEVTLARARSYSRGFGALMRKHRLGLSYLAERQARTFVSALLSLARLQFGRARYKFAWLAGVAHGYWSWRD